MPHDVQVFTPSGANMFDKKLYKYVDLDAAKYIERGSIKIGTLNSFRSLESDRGDNSEATLFVKVDNYFGGKFNENKRERSALKSLGINDTGENNSIHGISFVRRIQDLYCFCLSELDSCEELQREIPQAIFEIEYVKKFIRIVTRKYIRYFQACYFNSVTYRQNFYGLYDTDKAHPDPFVKHFCSPSGYSFEVEKECRVVWLPRRSVIEPIFTRESAAIANCFRRIQ